MLEEPPGSYGGIGARHAALENALYATLVRCARLYKISADEAFCRLTDIPPLLLLIPSVPPSDRPLEALVDREAQATLVRADQGRLAEGATVQWDELSKAEKQRAVRLARFA